MVSADIFSLRRGSTPLLVSLPHAGTLITTALESVLVERALTLEDTDWHLDSLYAFAHGMGSSLIVPRYSRYVIDLNRAPTNAPLYAGANNTALCPTRSFAGEPIYRQDRVPDQAEVARRRKIYW